MSYPDLANQITQAMRQYTAEVQKVIETSMRSVADQALARVRSGSPRRSGKYRRGWRATNQNYNGTIGFEIAQKDRPQLTHLLEYGHKTRSRKGFAAAQPHIKVVEEWAEKAAVDAIARKVSGG